MLYFLEKIVSQMLYPVPLFCELLIISFVLMFIKRKISGRIVFAMAIAFFLFLSFDAGRIFLADPLESEFPSRNPLDYPNVKKIVVLGGGRHAESQRPANAKLSQPSLVRLVEGMRIFNLINADSLIVTGKSNIENLSIAALMKQCAIDMGIDESKIFTVDNARTTREEAGYCAEFLKGDTVFLVTSATHLKRAVQYFEKEGIFVIPMPSDFQIHGNDKKSVANYFPSPYNLLNSNRSIHEYLGLLVEKIR